MNIKFKKLVLNNFFSFQSATLDLDKNGYILVSGVNNNKEDLAISNGSGKSSIWEAIVWSLTGETVRGTRNVKNNFSEQGCKVEITFELDGDLYRVIRTKDDPELGTNLKIFVNGQDKSGKGIRDSEKLLLEYLPDLSASLLGSVIILGQGLPQRFTNNSPSGRKDILEKLSKSDFMIADIKEKLSDLKTTTSTNLRKSEDLVLELESKKSVYSIQLQDKVKQLELLNSEPVVDFINELTDIDINISFKQSELTLAESNVKKSEEKLQESRVRYSTLDSELKSKQLDIATKYDRNELVKERYAIGSRISFLEENINTAKAVKDICPTCGQKLPNIHKIDTTDLEKELANLKVEDSRLLSAMELSKENENKEIISLQESYKELKNSIIEEGMNCKDTYNNYVAIRDNLNKEISDLQSSKAKLIYQRDNYLSNIDSIKSDIKSLESVIEELIEKILYNNIEKEKLSERLDIITKMITLATRDFRGFLLSEVIEFIDKKAKEYSQDIFETSKLDFRLSGNNIDITYCDKYYENLSGGEKQKVDLIVQFSLRDMLTQFLNFSSNILVLDEIFDNLDNTGCQKVLDLISNKLTDIQAIYMITHHTDIDIPYDERLIVVKDERGVSKIQ